MPLTASAPDDLAGRVRAALDRRLDRDSPRPVALALSGGGDSVALLHLAVDWAREAGRPLLALTLDHGLQPDSAQWTARAGAMARAAGVDWRGLAWSGPKPETGLPAAARAVRHALIADAARAAGARVILFGHTADDVAEADWMRARGATLGRLREWGPSPAWPEGRGLMLLRPLLGEDRNALRLWLAARGGDWLDDPANDDPRFGRGRARRALAERPCAPVLPRSGEIEASIPAVTGDGRILAGRRLSARALAAALVSAGGGDRPPRGDRLTRLADRLAAGEDLTAGLAGARIEARGPQVLICREPGDLRRRPRADLRLAPGRTGIWDGRFEITAPAGGVITAADGRLAALGRQDRATLAVLPSGARGGLPVLIRDDGGAPVLAWRAATVRCLVGPRLALALDQTTHERDLDRPAVGETPSNDLFSDETLMTGPDHRPAGRPRIE